MSEFLAVAWSLHLDLIPSEVGCVIPEPKEPSIVGQRPLFLREEEIIHSKQSTLQFRVFVKIVEIHDFSPTDDSSDDSSSLGDGSVGNGLPGPLLSTSLQLWPRVYWLGSASSSNGVPWLSLPEHGRDVIWFAEVGHGCKKQTPSTKVRHVKVVSHVQSPHRHVASTDGSTKPAPLGGGGSRKADGLLLCDHVLPGAQQANLITISPCQRC
jgi:hypothetical protein